MLKGEIWKRYELLLKAFEAGDYERIAAMYTDDAKIIIPEYGTFEGPEAIAGFYRAGHEKVGIETMTFEVLSAEEKNGLLASFISYTAYGKDDAILSDSWFMTVFKDLDGQLMFYLDLGI